MTTCSVVIAGAGSTGLMLAGELALAGVHVALVERRPNQELSGARALGISSRTIEVLETEGPFKTLENRWRFTPKDQGCEVEFCIEFEFKSRLLHSVAGHAFEKVLLKMTDAFEARAAALSRADS